jgi:8-amino-7-oxononanoate synthase
LSARDDLVVSDGHIHASLIDAARLARAEIVVAPHNDVAAVDAALAAGLADRSRTTRTGPRRVDLLRPRRRRSPAPSSPEIAQRHGALLVVDEAHGLGVVGDGGRGLTHLSGLAGHPNVVLTVTLSKAMGAQGGVLLGPTSFREHLVNTARPFIFDTALAPASAAGALAALRHLRSQPRLPDGHP